MDKHLVKKIYYLFNLNQNSILLIIRITPIEVRDQLKSRMIILGKFKRDCEEFLLTEKF